jgi:hypothetical protein
MWFGIMELTRNADRVLMFSVGTTSKKAAQITHPVHRPALVNHLQSKSCFAGSTDGEVLGGTVVVISLASISMLATHFRSCEYYQIGIATPTANH